MEEIGFVGVGVGQLGRNAQLLRSCRRTRGRTGAVGVGGRVRMETARAKEEPFFSKEGFSSLGLSPELTEALMQNGIEKPTSVQTKSIPAIYGGADVIVGAATGSGKTLSYLVPIVQMMKDQEQLQEFERVTRRPRAVVIVPTRELVEQVIRVAKSLSHHFKFRAVGLYGGSSSLKKQKEALNSQVDVIVTTAGRLQQHIEAFNVDLVNLRFVVFDEVDTLFEGGFANDVEKIVAQARRRQASDENLQFVAVGATHPTSALALYSKLLPSAKTINVDLHRAPPGLSQRFIHTTPGEKTLELAALLGQAEKDGTLKGGRIIIFTNSTESCRFLEHYLSEKDYSTSSIHGEMPREKRVEEFKKFSNRETQLLVGTDIASRGLDNLSIDHVILFDFPTSPVDYIHRAGRTARAGAQGRVTSFVTKRDRTLAEAIEQANRDKSDTLVQAQVRRREADARKAEEERLNNLRLEKEAANRKLADPKGSSSSSDKGGWELKGKISDTRGSTSTNSSKSDKGRRDLKGKISDTRGSTSTNSSKSDKGRRDFKGKGKIVRTRATPKRSR